MATRRRWWHWFGGVVAALAALFAAGVLLGAPVAYPFDLVHNLGGVVGVATLRAPADGKVRVVVLQHGLFRTARSLGRLQRTLAAHGYEVLNPGYPSTRGTIEQHAVALAAAIETRRAGGPVDEWAFVGHSLGGLVIEQYLRSPGAVAPAACVYLGTPHRGAMLADLRRHWFVFRWAMGTGAACQLSPGDPLHRLPLPWPERSGAVVGDLGAANPAIPGHDDGTVAVAEAHLPGAKAEVTLPVGHTGLTVADAALHQVLHFLAKGAFAPVPARQ
ncbi:MAG: hypothetical protein WAT39_22475 [Planctomycetota bacterium]